MPKNGLKDIPAGPLPPGQRLSLARKREAASRLLRGGGSAGAVPRESGVEICRLAQPVAQGRMKRFGGADADVWTRTARAYGSWRAARVRPLQEPSPLLGR